MDKQHSHACILVGLTLSCAMHIIICFLYAQWIVASVVMQLFSGGTHALQLFVYM